MALKDLQALQSVLEQLQVELQVSTQALVALEVRRHQAKLSWLLLPALSFVWPFLPLRSRF
jgi:hypothetical protein